MDINLSQLRERQAKGLYKFIKSYRVYTVSYLSFRGETGNMTGLLLKLITLLIMGLQSVKSNFTIPIEANQRNIEINILLFHFRVEF